MKKNRQEFDNLLKTLENQILTGLFRPGQRLVEAELTEKFKASRYWIRDALKLLCEKGLLEIVPYKGAIVKDLNAKEIEDIFYIRINLERMAIHQALPNLNKSELSKLEKTAKKFEKSFSENDIQEMISHNKNFHDHIFKLADNPTLYQLIVDMRTRLHVIRYSAWSSPQVLEKIVKEHRIYLQSLKQKDLKTLDKLCEKHISYSKDFYLAQQRTIQSLINGSQ